MKSIKNKIILFSIITLSGLPMLNSCSNDDTTITDPRRFTANDVQSYEDLFVVFWKTMDQQYNYFYEQKEQGGLDWDEIYNNYHPKFAALQTFGRATDDEGQINEDYISAKKYFEEIIDPIIDRHFSVQIGFPITSKNIIINEVFRGGMTSTEKINTYPFSLKQAYMQNRVNSDAFQSASAAIGLIAGNLTSNPDIFYLTFNQFAVASNLQISLADNYLNPGVGNPLVLTEQLINESEELNLISDPAVRTAVKNFTVDILNQYNSFSQLPVFTEFMTEATHFKNTEVVSNRFVQSAQNAFRAYNALPKYKQGPTYGSLLTIETVSYLNWFISKMDTNERFGYNFPVFLTGLDQVMQRGPFYQKFLNPLHNGQIKKIIIDLRSNGGGAVIDARFLSDRFITQNEIFAYQRSREGNGRFNYTPWVEARTNPHQFGIPTNIPIAILTDRGSASMSEITTLMLKSQGNQVVSVGDYSAGATAGLGTTDDFNGGTRDQIAGGRLTFYMPLLAMKDANGVVIEGVGVKPDIYVTPPTDDELSQMASSPSTFVDRALDEAINYLKSK